MYHYHISGNYSHKMRIVYTLSISSNDKLSPLNIGKQS